MTINYQLFTPGGNKTALVFGLEEDVTTRRRVQDAILARHAADEDGEVEQVGFIGLDKTVPELVMTGGEFCGNATRAAAAYYLDDAAGEIEIRVSGVAHILHAGRTATGEIWAEMPVRGAMEERLTVLEGGSVWVELDGISHLVVPHDCAEEYLQRMFAAKEKQRRLDIALTLLEETIQTHNLAVEDAYGLMLLHEGAEGLCMHPFVHVKTADTTYYESACGSGSMAVGLVKALEGGASVDVEILQPSGKQISAMVTVAADGTISGKIAGPVVCGECFEIGIA